MAKDKDGDMSSDVTQLSKKQSEAKKKASPRTYRRRSSSTTMRLRKLKCFPEVEEMVKAGEYARTIAAFIQEEAGEYLEVSFDAVIRSVYRYRQSLDKGGIVTQPGQEDVDEDDPMFELKAMEDKFRIQSDRIDMEVATEKALKKLFSTTHKEFEIFNLMGKDILKLKKQLNLLNSDAGPRGKSKGHVGRLDIARVVESPESRHKVLSFMETMIENPDLMDDLLEAKDSIDLPDVDEQKEKDVEPTKKSKKPTKDKKEKKQGARKQSIAKAKSRLKKKKKKKK